MTLSGNNMCRNVVCAAVPDHAVSRGWEGRSVGGAATEQSTSTSQRTLSQASFASATGRGALVSVSDKRSPLADKLNVPNDVLVIGLITTQAITLIGSLVTGGLARRRRLELVVVNEKLRKARNACPSQHATLP
jgi:hypothetical protein